MHKILLLLDKTNSLSFHVSFDHDDRKSSAGALLLQAHEHALAISFLIVDKKLIGCACALLRSCIEAYIRGSWLLNCASDAQVLKYTHKNTQWPNLTKQMLDLEKYYNRTNVLQRYRGKAMGILDSFNHGLSTLILHRLQGETLDFEIDHEQEYEILWEVVNISILSLIGMGNIANDQTIINSLEEIFKEFQSHEPPNIGI